MATEHDPRRLAELTSWLWANRINPHRVVADGPLELIHTASGPVLHFHEVLHDADGQPVDINGETVINDRRAPIFVPLPEAMR